LSQRIFPVHSTCSSQLQVQLNLQKMAGPTRLELATSGVTGRRSNRLNYDPDLSKQHKLNWWAVQGLNL
jgi:hypothetical protein